MTPLDWHINENYVNAEAYLHSALYVDAASPASAQDQLSLLGTLWSSDPSWKLFADNELHFPGHPPIPPVAYAWLRHERIFIYPSRWLAVFQPDTSFAVGQML